MNPQRVLSLPSTEDPASYSNSRQRLSDEYLEKAMQVVEATMKSADEKLSWDAAKWVAEMVMGKPKQEIEQRGGIEAEMARMLATAYASYAQEQAALPPVVEGSVYILGGVIEPDDLDPQVVMGPKSVRTIEYVEKRKPFEWDDLPE